MGGSGGRRRLQFISSSTSSSSRDCRGVLVGGHPRIPPAAVPRATPTRTPLPPGSRDPSARWSSPAAVLQAVMRTRRYDSGRGVPPPRAWRRRHPWDLRTPGCEIDDSGVDRDANTRVLVAAEPDGASKPCSMSQRPPWTVASSCLSTFPRFWTGDLASAVRCTRRRGRPVTPQARHCREGTSGKL